MFVLEEILLTITTTFATLDFTLLLEVTSFWTRCIANRQCFVHVRRFVVFVLEEILLAITTTFATLDFTLLLEVICLPGQAALLTVNVSHMYGTSWFLCLKKYCLLLLLLLLF